LAGLFRRRRGFDDEGPLGGDGDGGEMEAERTATQPLGGDGEVRQRGLARTAGAAASKR
jgi:hypothetical protein